MILKVIKLKIENRTKLMQKACKKKNAKRKPPKTVIYRFDNFVCQLLDQFQWNRSLHHELTHFGQALNEARQSGAHLLNMRFILRNFVALSRELSFYPFDRGENGIKVSVVSEMKNGFFLIFIGGNFLN